MTVLSLVCYSVLLSNFFFFSPPGGLSCVFFFFFVVNGLSLPCDSSRQSFLHSVAPFTVLDVSVTDIAFQ